MRWTTWFRRLVKIETVVVPCRIRSVFPWRDSIVIAGDDGEIRVLSLDHDLVGLRIESIGYSVDIRSVNEFLACR